MRGERRLQYGESTNPDRPVRRFELVDALVTGSSATASLRLWSPVTESYVTVSGVQFEVYDASGALSASAGTYGVAMYMADARRWEVISLMAGIQIAVLDGDLAHSGSATASVYTASAGTESDSGENVTVYDFDHIGSGKEIVSGTKVIIANIQGFWYVINAAACATTIA